MSAPSYPTELRISNFRSYKFAQMKDLKCCPIVLFGENGSGKTNILEALSWLSSGRGLRGVPAKDVQRAGEANPWGVWANINGVGVGSGLDSETKRRRVSINKAPAKGQSALSQHMSIAWLTPQMDRILSGAASPRRRFLDRLILSIDPSHSARVSRYESAVSQRMQLLRGDEKADTKWLDALEATISQEGVALAAARMDFSAKLGSESLARDFNLQHFPPAKLTYHAGEGLIDLSYGKAAIKVEEELSNNLKNSRDEDRRTGRTSFGAHKGDLHVFDANRNTPASFGSTGEQKTLLIGLILAHARLIAKSTGRPPVLLLDEVAAHMDPKRRQAMFAELCDIGGQVWLTGTEKELFSSLHEKAMFFSVQNKEDTSLIKFYQSSII